MRALTAALLIPLALACSHTPSQEKGNQALIFPGENHLARMRQLTFGGTNAEAYWSFDGKWLTFQHKAFQGAPACDQIYVMRDDGSRLQALTAEARTTCAYFLPDNSRVLYSSTISSGKECPPEPDKSRGYVWPIYDTYQMYSAKRDGSDVRPMEPGAPRAYNAEATVCKDGSVVFTSDRDGDLELYRGQLDSFGTMTDVKRLTFTPGYDGGAFFSQDCKKIVWRAARPKPGKELEEYQLLLKQHLVRPGKLEIWVADADGTHARQVTRVGAASFAPFFTPDSKRILFASNPRDPRGRRFDIYSIAVDGTGLERITFSETFDSFPMFSPDGKRLAFSSNRNAERPHETNVFVADWVETPIKTPAPDSPEAADRVSAWGTILAGAASQPGPTALQIASRLSTLGLKIITGENGSFPVIAQTGKSCSKPALLLADLADPMAAAGALEAAAMIQNLKQPGCAVLAWSFKSQFGSEILSVLAARKIRPTVTFSLTNISTMEANAVHVTSPDGREARVAKKIREIIEAKCSEFSLSCSFVKGTNGAGSMPAFQFSSAGPANGKNLNVTGAVQIAELLAQTVARAASQ